MGQGSPAPIRPGWLRQQRREGFRVYWALAVGLLSFSFSPILVRVASEAPGATVAVWRTVLAVFFLLPFAARTVTADWKSHSRRTRALTILAGILLGIHFVAWIESIYYTSVASASVLFTTNPLFIAIIGFSVLGERLERSTGIAIAVSVVGATLIGLGDASDDQFPLALLGNGLALSAAVFFAGYLLIGRVARQTTNWLAYVFPLYTVAAVTAVLYAVVSQVPFVGFGWQVYAACALMALGPQILGHGSLNYAVRFIPAAVLGLLGLIEPVLATIWAWLLLGEVPSPVAILGIAIVLSALLSVYWPKRNFSLERSENFFRPRKK